MPWAQRNRSPPRLRPCRAPSPSAQEQPHCRAVPRHRRNQDRRWSAARRGRPAAERSSGCLQPLGAPASCRAHPRSGDRRARRGSAAKVPPLFRSTACSQTSRVRIQTVSRRGNDPALRGADLVRSRLVRQVAPFHVEVHRGVIGEIPQGERVSVAPIRSRGRAASVRRVHRVSRHRSPPTRSAG